MRLEQESLSAKDSGRVIRNLAALCAVVLAAGLARKLHLHWLDIRMLDILRVRDIVTVFFFCPAVVFLTWRVFQLYKGNESQCLTGIMLCGYYLLGMGYGMHEPCNIMSATYAPTLSKPAAESLRFFDDYLGHWVFFGGFAVVCLAGVWAEARAGGLSSSILGIPAALLGLLIAGVFVHNMRGEIVTVDLFVSAAVAAGSLCIRAFLGRTSLPRNPCAVIALLGFGGGVAAVLSLNFLSPFR